MAFQVEGTEAKPQRQKHSMVLSEIAQFSYNTLTFLGLILITGQFAFR